MRAIDLYAGIGGWSLGLRLAGVDVVASYEWWQPAIDTHNANHGGELTITDVRKLRVDELPNDIDLVVGSPPCTEFSYANRGGSGDLAEGLKDLVKFFEVVDHLKPHFWAMENVPRVAEVLRQGFATKGHALYRFRHLKLQADIFDFSEYGAPQARRRCIATNIPLDAIRAYKAVPPTRTLGDVVGHLAAPDTVIDPIWGVRLKRDELTETQREASLNAEELRMNREAKEHHPVYNNMTFPDPLDKPARTVTATCTRVSRESIVISDPESPTEYRRLTIRERGSLQGFPITYQFFGRSFSDKAKMIGNAIPPTFTYILARTAMGGCARDFRGFEVVKDELTLPKAKGPLTQPDGSGKSYPVGRAFRAALPGFRFKSGMRFDLSNSKTEDGIEWAVRFYFGPSKDIRQIELDGSVTSDLRRDSDLGRLLNAFQPVLSRAQALLARTSPRSLQLVWAHRAEGISPYEVTDQLAELAEQLHAIFEQELEDHGRAAVAHYVLQVANGSAADGGRPVGQAKLERNALRVLSGMIVGEWFNNLDWHREHKAAA